MADPAPQQPQLVVLKDGDSLCSVDNELQKIPLTGDYYYLSGTPELLLKAWEKSLNDLLPDEVKNTRYPIPGSYKNVVVPEMVPLFVDLGKKLLPHAGDPRMGEAVTHATAGVFHMLHRLIHILRGSGDVNSTLRLLSSLARPEQMDDKGTVLVEVADLPWDDVNAMVGNAGKTLAAFFDDRPEMSERKTRSMVLRMRMNSVESVAFEADNRAMAEELRTKVAQENQFLFDAFLKTLSEQPFLRGLSSPLVRNRAIYAVLSRVSRGLEQREEKFTSTQNATLQGLGQMLSNLKSEQDFNNWYQEFVK